ncbi:MAG: 1-acyl-sn-glycerol-3-phosphate acyltransferase [Candidatus Omnitrophica bacterium]|nr:1-acyl-sn-glycerol-3-phosphate acyltransferase [Candidatus Omnitrophota bacterium]MBU0896119.1 1-acyl-sn-glycerol-3-phosphate acyltransferase [Candidatus Omnitrophota bacterium]MBU1133347.1 1-acyl-sn-glycerol-3-phosphate acyltransferase [Candidatus Omnitrophota bacterium]MBU1367314.1 1-acyl-sn-glycerol-3-phosphate acyltransferase [Candidatus Omnitrophota bacterium]MBU1524379.1 1-acyl-sn-glycerol-3-phosphate acyltransferase [Candidatus Omnitrophota bacterium]
MVYSLVKFLAAFFLKWLFKIEVKGKDIFPRNCPFILASNHSSYLDPLVLGSVCPRQLRFLAKEELFKNKLFALFMKALGVIPIARGKGNLGIMRRALGILKEKPLVIFPQGTRTLDYEKFKAGIGFLYKKSNVSIVAAKIYGTDEILPPQAKFIRKGKIKVIFDTVGSIDELDNYQEIASKVIDKIKSL